MMGLILKDFYTLRQYGKTLLFMFILFGFISIGLDNPATFFEGFIVMMAMMMAVYTFSYDNLAKWDRFGLSMPVTRKEVVAGKYIVSLILCLAGAAFSFLLTTVIMFFKPVTDFSLQDHLLSLAGTVTLIMIFFSILLPLIFKFGVEKSRILLIAVFAFPTAVIISMSQLGLSMPSEETIFSFLKFVPLFSIALYIFSFFLSVKIYRAKEI